MSDEDEEMYDFEYSSEGEEPQESDVSVSNRYYESKDLIDQSAAEALDGFQNVVDMEAEKGEWGMKALKQIVKIYFSQGNSQAMLTSYKDLLHYISYVPQTRSEKCVLSLLELVSGCDWGERRQVLQDFYQETLAALSTFRNERLWFRTNILLAKWYLEHTQYGKLAKVLKQLHKSCERADGTEDSGKGLSLLEVLAMEIQMHTRTKNNKQLKSLYEKAIKIKVGIADPRIVAVIRECGGKMYMMELAWENAQKDFFQAFLSYDEFGSPRRIQCLKYLVLVHLLMAGSVDPLGSLEAQQFKTHPEIVPLVHLLEAYRNDEIKKFEQILRDNQTTIMNDEFLSSHITELLRATRGQILMNILKPYTRVSISFIAQELNIKETEVEDLLTSLILDKKIDGQIDQVNNQLHMRSSQLSEKTKTYQALDEWKTHLQSLHATVFNKSV